LCALSNRRVGSLAGQFDIIGVEQPQLAGQSAVEIFREMKALEADCKMVYFLIVHRRPPSRRQSCRYIR
jgi:hypothetical protein